MQYILLIYADEKAVTARMNEPAAAEQVLADYFAFNSEAKAAGVLVAGDALQDTHTATTVRMSAGKVLHTDGPFAETKEQLGGYYLLECKNLDHALEWAAKCPAVRHGQSVEVRPVAVFE